MQNIEINQNEIPKISTARRILPQVRSNEDKPRFLHFNRTDANKTNNVYLNCSSRLSGQWQKISTFSIWDTFQYCHRL